MSLTSTSKLLVDVRDLSLRFRLHSYRSWTLRDQFVKMASNPLRTFSVLPSEKRVVLKNVNIQIHEGDRVGILGVNGVGKTTLCRSIMGAYSPSGGSVRLYGRPLGIFDTAVGVYPELTGRENARLLLHFLYPQHVDKHPEMLQDALDFSELGEFLDSPFRIYSNGMQARLCLSLISCAPSEILILDEVFDGADKFFREKMATRILSVIDRSGAVIFVSHAENQVRDVCNRVILLDRGQVAFDGDVAEGLREYTRLSQNQR